MKDNKKVDDLNPELQDKVVGFKVTQTKKEELVAYCSNKGYDNVSRFIRYCVKKEMNNG